MNKAATVPDPVDRTCAMRWMYDVRSTVHPLTGVQYGPNTLGSLDKVEKVFTDQGEPKG